MNFNILYLHGFASGPDTYKGQFFKSKFKQNYNIDINIPDLNLPSFENLSISSQIKYVTSTLKNDAINVLIGSSLGGLIALLVAENELAKIDYVFAIAPAINMVDRSISEMKIKKNEHLKSVKSIPIFHHYYKREMTLSRLFLEDLLKYDTFNLRLIEQTYVFHGQDDTEVPIGYINKYLEPNPNCHLMTFKSDHRMLDCLEDIWEKIRTILFN